MAYAHCECAVVFRTSFCTECFGDLQALVVPRSSNILRLWSVLPISMTRPAIRDGLQKASLPVGDTLIAWQVFQWIIHGIDDYGRLESFVSLQKYFGFFTAAWFTPCALGAGVLLLLVNQQAQTNRSLVDSSKRLVVNGELYVPKLSYRWLWLTVTSIVAASLAGTIFSILWLRFYSPELPISTLIIPVPHICKTSDCWPKATKPKFATVTNNSTSGASSPIVSGSGNVITYNNVGPESATPEQKKAIRIALSRFLQRGGVLRKRALGSCSDDPDLQKDANAWYSEAWTYLNDHLDASFNAQFERTYVSNSHPSELIQSCEPLYYGIDERVETLNKFIDEFK